jgi:Protein of unknown function (DUF3617)
LPLIPVGPGFRHQEEAMRTQAMRRVGAASFVLVTGAVPAFTAELPNRKAGLWEITTDAGNQAMKIQQCIDAATDHAMQARGGAAPQGDCSKRDVQKSGNTTTIDSVCTFGGKTRTSHVVITGSFDSEYTMTVTGQTEGQPAGRTVTLSAKWLGPCAADQRPGDMIMPNGMKMNIQNMQNMQKGMMPPGGAGAPPGH